MLFTDVIVASTSQFNSKILSCFLLVESAIHWLMFYFDSVTGNAAYLSQS